MILIALHLLGVCTYVCVSFSLCVCVCIHLVTDCAYSLTPAVCVDVWEQFWYALSNEGWIVQLQDKWASYSADAMATTTTTTSNGSVQ